MDNSLLAIAASQPATIADVIAALETIDGLLPDTDGLKWFNWLYLTVTKAVDLNISAGNWHNPAWLTQLDIVFAGLYLSALSAWLTPGETAPKCWTILFDARNDAKLARVQFALAGINAHIDHDLSEAVVETCRQFGIAPVHQSPEYLDYTLVNSILDPIVDQAKAQLLTGRSATICPPSTTSKTWPPHSACVLPARQPGPTARCCSTWKKFPVWATDFWMVWTTPPLWQHAVYWLPSACNLFTPNPQRFLRVLQHNSGQLRVSLIRSHFVRDVCRQLFRRHCLDINDHQLAAIVARRQMNQTRAHGCARQSKPSASQQRTCPRAVRIRTRPEPRVVGIELRVVYKRKSANLRRPSRIVAVVVVIVWQIVFELNPVQPANLIIFIGVDEEMLLRVRHFIQRKPLPSPILEALGESENGRRER
jgi:Family of unknown function (DUF5995)